MRCGSTIWWKNAGVRKKMIILCAKICVLSVLSVQTNRNSVDQLGRKTQLIPATRKSKSAKNCWGSCKTRRQSPPSTVDSKRSKYSATDSSVPLRASMAATAKLSSWNSILWRSRKISRNNQANARIIRRWSAEELVCKHRRAGTTKGSVQLKVKFPESKLFPFVPCVMDCIFLLLEKYSPHCNSVTKQDLIVYGTFTWRAAGMFYSFAFSCGGDVSTPRAIKKRYGVW